MKKLLSILFLLCYTIFLHSQNPQKIEDKALHFQLNEGTDSLDFILIDTSLNQRKPLFLFCQGSLPSPLFVKIKERGLFMFGGGISNFDIQKIRQHYHLIVISMPHTPLIARQEELDRNFSYLPDPSKPGVLSQAFIKADYLEKYVVRAQAVLDFLCEQEWVDPSNLVAAGHSQGSKVASRLAKVDKRISHLGLFAANPFGRIDQFVRQERYAAQLGKKTWEEAEQEMEETYEFYRQVYDEDSLAAHPEYLAWKSFSYPFYLDWLEIEIPIYLAYGTEDRTADLCDIVPLFFIQKGKNNLKLKRYLNLEHNFFEVEEGRPNYEKAHWPEVMNAFVDWTLSTPNPKE